jgi:uncharacterized membrane protein
MLFARYLFSLSFTAAIGCGLIAGVFFAFSTFVMPALARLQPDRGIAAMQSINITAINPLFMLALLGTTVACLFIVISALLGWHQSGTIYLSIGSLLYLVGTMLVTMLGNVPLNYALAIVDPNSTEGTTLWSKYLTNWTFWNHVRTLAALAASETFIISLPK